MNNTCNVYDAFSGRDFHSFGEPHVEFWDASQRVRYVSPRMENTGGVGIGIKANAQSTVVMGEFSLELHSASG